MKKMIPILCVAFMMMGCATTVLNDPSGGTPTGNPEAVGVAPAPAWDLCTKASCWSGSNAQIRNMNILSPRMSYDLFKQRVAWQKNRGCNTVHVFLSNKGDGEYSGYCIYGNSWDWGVDSAFVAEFNKRIGYIRSQRMGVVVWLFADDSDSWNTTASKNFPQYAKDLSTQGLFEHVSTVVVGLELSEYFSVEQVKGLVSAVRRVYTGRIGTHSTSGDLRYAALADIVFYQVSPGRSASWIKAETKRVVALVNKPVNFFELSRHEDRTLSKAALDGGAYGVANW